MHELAHRYLRRNQDVNVFGHHYETMKVILKRMAIANRVNHQRSDFGPSQVGRPSTTIGKEPVHDEEYLARGGPIWKSAVWRKATVKPPCDEHWPADLMNMRQAASMERGHMI